MLVQFHSYGIHIHIYGFPIFLQILSFFWRNNRVIYRPLVPIKIFLQFIKYRHSVVNMSYLINIDFSSHNGEIILFSIWSLKNLWLLVLLTMARSIWKERNNIIFKRKKRKYYLFNALLR